MRVLLMRHAQSRGNAEGRLLGGCQSVGCLEPDPFDCLTATGQTQAAALGRWLTEQPRPTHLYSSPLGRACETWEMVQASCPAVAGQIVCCDRQLQEIDQGILSGLTWAEAQQQHPLLCAQLEASPDLLPIPQAESPQSSRQRAETLVSSWLAQHCNQDCLWVITHGGFLNHLISALLGCDRTWGHNIPSTALFEFELDLLRWKQPEQNRFNMTLWKVNRFNSTVHLIL